MTLLRHLLLATAALAVGAGTGVAAVAVHATPWGWPLAVVTALLAAWALPGAWWGRLAFCWGFAGVVFALTPSRPNGGYLVSADLPGQALLVVAVVLAVLGPVGALRRRSSGSAQPSGRPVP